MPRLLTIGRPLAGLSEVSQLFGVSKARAGEIVKRSDFPVPTRLAAGPVWYKDEVEKYIETHPKYEGPGRKASYGPDERDRVWDLYQLGYLETRIARKLGLTQGVVRRILGKVGKPAYPHRSNVK